MNKDLDENEVDYFYNNYYFNLNKKLQIWAGLWPYETRSNKLIPQIVLYVILFVAVLPLFNGFRIWCGVDLDVCGENILGIAYATTVVTKTWVTAVSENKLKIIYERVAKNWMDTTDPEEQAILEEFAKQGRMKTIGYVVFMIMAGISFCQMPMIPVILDLIMPLNESRPNIPFVRGEFIFDPVKHFPKLYLFFMTAAVATIIAMTSIDTTYTVIVEQILGIFAIVKHRIHQATISLDLLDKNYDIIIEAIRLHNEALQFIEFIETSYRPFFLIVMGPTILFVTIGVVIITEVDTILVACRCIMILLGAIIHFLYLSWPGQKIIDHSSELFISTYANEWYNTSEKSKRLLKIVMLRSLKPCTFTAAGLYTMNLENFGSIIKSALSYVAIVSSFR